MSSQPALRLLEPVLPSLPATLPAGRLIELSGPHGQGCARTTTAVSIVRAVQREGDTAAWIQPQGGALYPPDLEQSGIDLDALVVVHVPRHEGHVAPHRACKAAEVLLRSGAFGLVVLDFCEGTPSTTTEAWQGRLLGLARQHHARVVMLTDKPAHADSLGALVGLRIEPRRFDAPTSLRPQPHQVRRFTLDYAFLKNKSGAPLQAAQTEVRGPWGLA